MKIFTSNQIKLWDLYTIEHQPIESIVLMEKASLRIVEWIESEFDEKNHAIHIFCGQGNNGGDGLAIARLLHRRFYNVSVYIIPSKNPSNDFIQNKERLPKAINIHPINKDKFPSFQENDIIVDTMIGTGLKKQVKGTTSTIIEHLNHQKGIKIAVDLPSGLLADKKTEGKSFQADYTLSFQQPKKAFFIPENEISVGKWLYFDIGLHYDYYNKTKCDVFYFINHNAQETLKKRSRFAHKGNLGHALLICGAYGKVGAAILAAKGALRSGLGLLTVHLPEKAISIMQTYLPEAMCSIDKNDTIFSKVPVLENYTAIGIGSGIGKEKLTKKAVLHLLKEISCPLIIDADALNIIAEENAISQIPRGSIITPHRKEFERLFGKQKDSWDAIETAVTMAKKHQIIIIMKGANTCVVLPDGTQHFNSTGNSGMATAGSGDVLMGIITSLCAQGYKTKDAARLGVYLHGLAGDLALRTQSKESLIASDIIENLGAAFELIGMHQKI